MGSPTPKTKVHFSEGDERALRFDNEALVRVEEETGKTPVQIAMRLQVGSFAALNRLAWTGLLYQGRENGSEPPTMEEVVGAIDTHYYEEIAQGILGALEDAGLIDADAEGEAGNALMAAVSAD